MPIKVEWSTNFTIGSQVVIICLKRSSYIFHHLLTECSFILFALCCLVRHFFVNDAYDNLDSMAMGNTNRGSSEYAEPVTPNGTHPSVQTAPRQDPAAFFTGKHSEKKMK